MPEAARRRGCQGYFAVYASMTARFRIFPVGHFGISWQISRVLGNW